MSGPSLAGCQPSTTDPGDVAHTRESLIAALLLCAALIAVFWGFLQLDLPLAWYVRSLHVPWLERVGDMGYRLGSGVVLAGISSFMLIIGVIFKHPSSRMAGLESLLAHAIAGLSAQILKHGIGRPRPRLMHGESPFLMGPSLEPGLDSFPSGHAAASFAVATVLTRYFPKAGWVMYGLAALIALSRIVRGSHFPTDVMAGVSLGLLVGYVVTHPLRTWKASLLQALTMATPFLVVAFALIWIAVYPSSDRPASRLMVIAGVMAAAVGMGIRLSRKLAQPPRCENTRSGLIDANVLLAIGVALTTGSQLIAMIAMFVSVAYWMMRRTFDIRARLSLIAPLDLSQSASVRSQDVLAETSLALLLTLCILSIQQAKGLLPLFP